MYASLKLYIGQEKKQILNYPESRTERRIILFHPNGPIKMQIVKIIILVVFSIALTRIEKRRRMQILRAKSLYN